MRADPEPDDHVVVLHEANDPVTSTDACRVHRFHHVNPLEVQTRMMGVGLEQLVSDPRLITHVGREASKALPKRGSRVRFHSLSGSSGSVSPARYSRRASAAIFARKS